MNSGDKPEKWKLIAIKRTGKIVPVAVAKATLTTNRKFKGGPPWN
jgi:hypothetical protein